MREIIAGVSTFSTLSYIIFVQPAILSKVGADFYTVVFATCVSSAIATLILGATTNLPFAIAPAMGHNIFFAFTICSAFGLTFYQGMFVNFLSALTSLLVSLTGVLWITIDKMPKSIKIGITSGIGLLIGIVGFQWGGIIEQSPETIIKLGNIKSVPFLSTSLGLIVSAVLYSLNIRFSIIFGILVSTLVLLNQGYIKIPEKIFSIPSLPERIINVDFFIPEHKILDIISAFLVLLILDVFDTAGTLVGLFTAAGITPEKKIVKKSFVADSLGAVAGTVLGTTTLTTYIESAVGIKSGGRTKITAFTISFLFILSLFLLPIIQIIGEGIKYEGKILHPQIAPAMIFVGFTILSVIKDLDFDDITESFPAIITLLIMGFSLSITDGIAFGFISYTILKIFSGRAKELNMFVIIVSALFLIKIIID
ncbi:MAG: NCS2 family permease [Candidatus Calescibacterium sp.]|nr:NCS2 family permease [Candidatus Calescibacterium sp.]MDW8086881.1 NCS2 family permease [Candidatus Calescibacterium sp.]